MNDLFLVELAVTVGLDLLKKSANKWIASFILSGPVGFVLSYYLRKFLCMLVERSILAIDLGIIGMEIAKEYDEYKRFTREAYEKAVKRVYTEDEKESIRKSYIEALGRFGTFGMHDSTNSKY